MNKVIRNSCFIVFFIVVFLSIGYSAFQSSLVVGDISSTIRARADIRVTGVVATGGNSNSEVNLDGYTNYDEYDVSSIESDIVLPSKYSTVNYRVEITNFGSQEMALTNISGVPSNMEIKNLTYLTNNVYGVKLCDGNRCNNGNVNYVDVTIGYISSVSNVDDTPVEMHLDFTFKKVYNISYVGFSNLSGLDTYMVESSSKSITFGSSNPIPSIVNVSGASSSYTSPTLTIFNPTGDVTITRAFTITYVDFTGNTSGLLASVTSFKITFNLLILHSALTILSLPPSKVINLLASILKFFFDTFMITNDIMIKHNAITIYSIIFSIFFHHHTHYTIYFT